MKKTWQISDETLTRLAKKCKKRTKNGPISIRAMTKMSEAKFKWSLCAVFVFKFVYWPVGLYVGRKSIVGVAMGLYTSTRVTVDGYVGLLTK